MTAINFPDSPSDGDTHVVGGVTYTYNNAETKWKTTINSNAFLPLSGGTVSGNILMGGEIQHDGDTDTNIAFDTDTILFDTAGSERFRVGSAGQLGIGGATYGTSGQVLTSQGSSSAPQWATPSGTTWTESSASLSGASQEWTGIPSDARQIIIAHQGWSNASSSQHWCQIGDSGGFETTGYYNVNNYLGSSTGGSDYDNQSAFIQGQATDPGNEVTGTIILSRLNSSNQWTIFWVYSPSNAFTYFAVGNKSLSGTLDRVRILPSTGNFDAGIANLMYLS